jgi:circadian clock protein KaiC
MTLKGAAPEFAEQISGPGKPQSIKKKPTGIEGFDAITEGGIPEAGITALLGDPGSGKTVFSLQTLVHGLKARGEKGIFVAFEEHPDQIRRNFGSFDWAFGTIRDDDIKLFDARLPMDAMRSGAFDLSGLLAGLSAFIRDSGAATVVFDGLDVLLGGLRNEALERQEMVRLSEWARDTGITALITVKAEGHSTSDQIRADMLQFMTDCVVVFQGCLTDTTFSRTLRVGKYRGSGFAASPVPAVIGASGLEVVGFKNMRASYPTFSDRVSSGVPRLDALLDGGYLRGSCTLVSGAPGTAKTSLGASFLAAACSRGESSLFVSFDESSSQIISNMRSIGIDLEQPVHSGLLTMESLLSASRSPEEHFVAIRKLMDLKVPRFLVIDPLSALMKVQHPFAAMVCESILDLAKSRGISVVCTSLLDQVSGEQELSASHVSTIADTWIHLSYVAYEGERNRALTVIKSRGTAHSNQVRELVLGSKGIEVIEVYSAEGEVLMGSARVQKKIADQRAVLLKQVAEQRTHFEVEKSLEGLRARAQIASQELEWKEREWALLQSEELLLREAEEAGGAERLDHRGK